MKKFRLDGDRIALLIISGFLLLFAVVTAYPFVHIVAKSLSSYEAVMLGKVSILPVELQFETYKHIFTKLPFMRAFFISLFVAMIGTILCIVLVGFTAYPLSFPYLKGRKFLIIFLIIPMFLDAGFIPNYLLMRSLNLLDTLWAMIIPLLLLPVIILIVKNYFESIPFSLIESARIDGASDLIILGRIIAPMSKPIIATVTVFMSVSYWNNFTYPLLYIGDASLYPLPVFLYQLIQFAKNPPAGHLVLENSGELVIYAAAVATALPVIVIYPFLQKYYIKGVSMGAIKG